MASFFLTIFLCCCTADVDTRAITRILRQYGSRIGVLSTEKFYSDEELLEKSRTWDIVGNLVDLKIIG